MNAKNRNEAIDGKTLRIAYWYCRESAACPGCSESLLLNLGRPCHVPLKSAQGIKDTKKLNAKSTT
jgi:hypothetical protein